MVDVPSSKHGIWAMVIHPILGIITMGILNPIDVCMTIPLNEKTNHVLTRAHIEVFVINHQFINLGVPPIYGCLKIP